ncbi:hypothetical protein PLICRDRAFT_100726, partial [Plicaturopsis crispa FD-325 SS-3]
ATGGGKTAIYYGPILIYWYLLSHPLPDASTQRILPRKPVAIIVSPLIELGNTQVNIGSPVEAKSRTKPQVIEIHELGINAVALNSEDILAARRMGRDLHTEIRQCQFSVVLVTPNDSLHTNLLPSFKTRGF